MSFLGQMTDTEAIAKKRYIKLLEEVRKGIFSDAKFDLLITNFDEFMHEYLCDLEDAVRAEVIGIIKHVIITGFYRSQNRKALADAAERN